MKNLPEHIEDSIRQRTLFRRGERILVAVSGGLDSMVLLHLLRELAPHHRWKLAIAHLNHQLRGRSSGADERLVRRTAEKLGLPVFVERADVRAFAKRRKLSLEMAARQVRHEFLARAAAEWTAKTIALAHHADDQVELFFLRLLRGSGGEGLGGMKWRSPSPAKVQTQLVRLLLDVSRTTLAEYAHERGIPFREDASNAARDILRNRIRHELLPLLKRQYQPALGRTVPRLMEILGAEAAFVRAAAQAWLRRKSRPAFAKLAVALQRACLQAQLLEAGITPDFDLIETLRETPDRPVTVKPGLAVSRDQAGVVRSRATEPPKFKPDAATLVLSDRAGKCEFSGLRVRWRVTRRPGAQRPAAKPGVEFFDADGVGSPITLRHWRPGDRFEPIGLGRAAKVQDLLTNARIPRERRRALVLAVAADGRIFWVEGLRLGEPAKLTPRTIRRLQWRWQRV